MRRGLGVGLLIIASVITFSMVTAPAAQATSTSQAPAAVPSGDGKDEPPPTVKADQPTTEPPIAPQGQCFLGCSQTLNNSQSSVMIGRNWCVGASPWAGDWMPNCTSGGVSQGFQSIYPDQHSPDGQDWDTFRVDRGWCYSITMLTWPGPWSSPFVYDRRGSTSGLWVKVRNNELAVVTSQGTNHC